MKISLLQWNVWVEEKADNVREFIQATDADIVCLQELTQTSQRNPGRDVQKEIRELGYEAAYILTVDKPEWRMGNGLFSKFPMSGVQKTYLRHEVPGAAGPSNESRGYIECRLQIGETNLTVGTTHLSFTPGFIFLPEKEKEADQFLSAIGSNSANFIFCGDFNALPNSRLIAELDKKFKHAGPDYTKATWTTKPFDYMDFKADELNWRLDYVYTTPDIKVVSSQILKTNYSDHLPILTEIEI